MTTGTSTTTDSTTAGAITGPTTAVRVRYFAGAAAAAGRDDEVVALEGSTPTLGDLLALLRAVHPQLAAVLDVASTLVEEISVDDPATPLAAGALVDVLPPFAGG